MSEQLDAVLAGLGYTRRDVMAGKDLELRPEPGKNADVGAAPAYPHVVMIQGRSTGESWVRDHAGQLMLAAGVGVFGLAALAVVALVAMVTAVALVVMAASLTVIRGVASSQAASPRRGWRR
jgi:hypothetical protein